MTPACECDLFGAGKPDTVQDHTNLPKFATLRIDSVRGQGRTQLWFDLVKLRANL